MSVMSVSKTTPFELGPRVKLGRKRKFLDFKNDRLCVNTSDFQCFLEIKCKLEKVSENLAGNFATMYSVEQVHPYHLLGKCAYLHVCIESILCG